MASPNLNMRDPVMYRILHMSSITAPATSGASIRCTTFAHGQSDSIERITHSICTLEFEDHRPLYDWYIEQLGIYHPQQIEFDRLNLTYTLLSKRKLLALVQNKLVQRLGRSAHADYLAECAAVDTRRGAPKFLRADRRIEDQRLYRAVAARIFRARRSEQAAQRG